MTTKTKLQTYQMVNDEALKALGRTSRAELKDIFSAINKDFEFPLRPHATFPSPNSRLNFGESKVPTGDGANRVLPPVKGQIATLSANPYIDFMTGASSASDFDMVFPSSTQGMFRRAGFTLLGSGQIKVIFSDEFGAESFLPNAGSLLVNGGIPLGFIDLVGVGGGGYKTPGASTSVIQNAGVFRFGSGAGGGGGSGDASDFTENLKHRLAESFFNYVTPAVFGKIGAELTESSTGSFSVAEEAYVLNIAQHLTSKNLFCSEFLATGNLSRNAEVHLHWLDAASLDSNPNVQLSLNGGLTWTSCPVTRQGQAFTSVGRISISTANAFDLRLKVTASGNNKKLKAFGVFYDEFMGTVSADKTRQEEVVFSGDTPLNQFSLLNIVPDKSKMKVFDVNVGQVYIYPAFDVVAGVITFPVGMFSVPGETIKLVFEQL
jgi:hypothetical protein